LGFGDEVSGSVEEDIRLRRRTMGKWIVGLQRGLSTILEGVQIPDEAKGRGPASLEAANQTVEHVRLDPIALFEKVARDRRCQTSVWSRFRSVFLAASARKAPVTAPSAL
jgi:hypothetical protein